MLFNVAFLAIKIYIYIYKRSYRSRRVDFAAYGGERIILKREDEE